MHSDKNEYGRKVVLLAIHHTLFHHCAPKTPHVIYILLSTNFENAIWLIRPCLWAYIHGRALCDVERQTVPTHGQMRDDRFTFDRVWGLFDVRRTSHIIQCATVYVGPISRSRLMHTE